jgi:N-acyl-D-aspartate/D-glutamate deacylase
MFDLVIRNGALIDGTGSPARYSDITMHDGRVVDVGRASGAARRVVDVGGLVVSPGFVDVHTHYDAQVMWDGMASPSSLHGVTTILGGNCGFTIAPMTPEHAPYLLQMLARVEGMALDVLETCIDPSWRSFGEWLACLDGRLAVNAGFLVGHSTIRRLVMGEAATGEPASAEQLEAMVRMLRAALDEGALGFSSSRGEAHNDHLGDPVPSRFATDDELLALCGALRERDGVSLEFIPTIGQRFSDKHAALMADMALAGNCPLNWNLLTVRSGQEEREARSSKLAASDVAREKGATVVALMLPEPTSMRLNLATGVILDTLPGWDHLFRLPVEQRIASLRDAEVRDRLAHGAARIGYRHWTDWGALRVADVQNRDLAGLVGRSFSEIAAERRTTPFDAMLDIVTQDGLATGLETPTPGDDDKSWRERAMLWHDDRVVVGGSDAGAHLDMAKTFAFSTRFLAVAVRERQLVPLETAVQLMTDRPARLYGLHDRGRLVPGARADVVVFDPDAIDSEPVTIRRDLPTGAERLTADAVGIDRVFVNGVETICGGQSTGARPGHVLRRGRDTSSSRL